jgi:ubiquinol-cytochrome c reductase cytochrome b subunit
MVFLMLFAAFVFFAPTYMGHAINFEPANPLVTPAHIVPEWYFLPYYAILRAVPDKLLGVVLMFGSILILLALPWLDTSKVKSATFRPIYRQFFWVFVVVTIVLGVVGANPPEGGWLILGRIATVYYFLHFLVILPLIGVLETPRPLPASISDAVLAGKKVESQARAAQ